MKGGRISVTLSPGIEIGIIGVPFDWPLDIFALDIILFGLVNRVVRKGDGEYIHQQYHGIYTVLRVAEDISLVDFHMPL
jgi:hypothetical protein